MIPSHEECIQCVTQEAGWNGEEHLLWFFCTMCCWYCCCLVLRAARSRAWSENHQPFRSCGEVFRTGHVANPRGPVLLIVSKYQYCSDLYESPTSARLWPAVHTPSVHTPPSGTRLVEMRHPRVVHWTAATEPASLRSPGGRVGWAGKSQRQRIDARPVWGDQRTGESSGRGEGQQHVSLRADWTAVRLSRHQEMDGRGEGEGFGIRGMPCS